MVNLKVSDAELDNTNKICINLKGVKFMATDYSLTLYLDDEIADSLAFQIQSLIQDHDFRKNGLPK
jgi:hypothetical protein